MLKTFLWLAVTLTCARINAQEQKGALDVYTPNLQGSLQVDLDHFRFDSSITIPLNYLGYDRFRKDENSYAPVFLYCGNEGNINGFYNASGGMFEMAEEFGAIVIFIEHRWYGESLPFGKHSFDNDKLVYLTIEQSLADLSQAISMFPKLLNCKSKNGGNLCDVILFGGSYGGMLAAWHRYKYPHLSVGALASGAPVDFYPYQGVQKAFKDAFTATYESHQRGCGSLLTRAINSIESASSVYLKKAGVITCNSVDVPAHKFAFYAKGAAASLAMIDYPYPCDFIAPLPANPVNLACNILNVIQKNDVEKILGIVNLYVNSTGDLKCFNTDLELVGLRHHMHKSTQRRPLTETTMGVTSWNYQACTEMILEPLTSDGYGFYPPDDGEETQEVIENCKTEFGVFPRPKWMPLSFGTASDLTKHVTNVLFMENSKDPWHVGTLNIKNNTANEVYRFLSVGGAHHQDLRFSDKRDSIGVTQARMFEKKIFSKWLGMEPKSRKSSVRTEKTTFWSLCLDLFTHVLF